MVYEGPAFYDDDAIFQTYMSRRGRQNNPNDTLEKPVIMELIGDFMGKGVLDLGCGDAALGREALAKGCQTYLGIEGSRNMVEAAHRPLLEPVAKSSTPPSRNGNIRQAFDLVVSRLALHYIQDLSAVFRQVFHSLAVGGRFVFSVEHPVITSCDRSRQGDSLRQDWIVDDYFDTGQRTTTWMGGQVVKYHRTVENYFVDLQQAGFIVESLREAEPQRDQFGEDDETYQRRKRIP
jgi:SAM-dependent methyltransferase